ncbi:MAG: GNAT family N-acetyltransferase [Asgard group archaeon]|nr:GNAT family N-acetyltransferase [Asgard group archaeon]
MSELIELVKKDFISIKPLVQNLMHYINIPAYLKGFGRGRIWVDDTSEPKSAVIWDLTNTFIFLAGDAGNQIFNNGFKRLIKDVIAPIFLEKKIDLFYFISSSTDWEKQLPKILGKSELDKRLINHYVYNPDNFHHIKNWCNNLPPNLEMIQVTKDFLEKDHLVNFGTVDYCISAVWQSAERYLKDGMGFCLVDNDSIASWCTTDYVIDNNCEIYIETFEGFKKKGYASLVASAVIEKCLRNNCIIHWHCWETNIGSVKTAEKVGFEFKGKDVVFLYQKKSSVNRILIRKKTIFLFV